jgi:hypothetical protein
MSVPTAGAPSSRNSPNASIPSSSASPFPCATSISAGTAFGAIAARTFGSAASNRRIAAELLRVIFLTS